MGDRESDKRDFFQKIPSNEYVYATIVYVDTENNICDAIGMDGMRFIPHCQYLNINLDGSGKIEHPCSGNTCVIKICSDGSATIERIYTVSSVKADGTPQVNLGPYAKFMPGDYVRLAKGGAFLQLLRNGLTKIGVTPICQMIFMKLESYTRWISRNIEILASGFRFYSVNSNSVNVTRLSLFLNDAMSSSLRNASSESSDFEISVRDNALSIMYGPKDSATGKRINATMIDMVNTGALIVYQRDRDTGSLNRRIMYNPNGCSEDAIYEGSNVLYQKTINKTADGKGKSIVSIEEIVSGDYSLIVEGSTSITGGDNLELNGTNIGMIADAVISTQSPTRLSQHDLNA